MNRPARFEGCLVPGRPEAATLRADGSQALRFDGEGLQVLAFGRIRFVDAALAERARALGTGAALAEGWRRHGAGLPERIRGEYLLAVWCAAERRGVAAVDRFGTYALFWGEHDGRLAFATTPAGVCQAIGRATELDARAVHAYVHFHMIPAPLTILRGVRRLDIGEAVAIERGEARVQRHWVPRFSEDLPFDFECEKRDFLAALRSGVAECIEDVPRERLGCFLSGGTDSSTIAGLVTQAYGAPARTFSIGFDVSGYDERHYSRLASRHFGTEHVEHVMTPADAEGAIEVLARSYEQPFGNSSAVPTYVCASIARQAGVTRMLGGDGGDELYGGNERYAKQWLFSLYDRVPGFARMRIVEPLLAGALRDTAFWPVRKARAYVEQATVPLPERLGSRYNLLNQFGAGGVFTGELLAQTDGFDPLALEREHWRLCEARSQINRLLAYDFKFTLGDNDLVKVTRMCHAAGVEIAFPMLTDALVEHSLRLAPGQKLRRTRLRHFFREALRGFLPDEIVDKRKHGFGMPFGEWMLAQPALAQRVEDALDGLARRGLVRPAFLAELRHAIHAQHAGYFGTMAWVLMMLELWLRAHVDVRTDRVPDASGVRV